MEITVSYVLKAHIALSDSQTFKVIKDKFISCIIACRLDTSGLAGKEEYQNGVVLKYIRNGLKWTVD